MSLYSQSDIANLCNVSRVYISKAVKKGLLLKAGKFIDSGVPENQSWIESTRLRQSAKGVILPEIFETEKQHAPPVRKKKKKPAVKKPKPKPAVKKPKPKPVVKKPKPAVNKPKLKPVVKPVIKPEAEPEVKPKPASKKTVKPPAPSNLEQWNIERRKIEADIKLKEGKIRIQDLQEAKLRGDNIPTSMVESVISTLGHSFQSSYKNGASQIMMNIAHELKMKPDVEAKYKGELINLINSSHVNAIKQAKLDLKNIVDQVSAGKK